MPNLLLLQSCYFLPNKIQYEESVFETFSLQTRAQLMQWAGGLRGAIAYALALNMPHAESSKSQSIETATLLIVVFTTLVFGAATGPLLTFLNLKASSTSCCAC